MEASEIIDPKTGQTRDKHRKGPGEGGAKAVKKDPKKKVVAYDN